MKLFGGLSFRWRIALWTAAMFGVSLILFGYGLFLTQRERLRAGIDEDLVRSAGRFLPPPVMGPGQGPVRDQGPFPRIEQGNGPQPGGMGPGNFGGQNSGGDVRGPGPNGGGRMRPIIDTSDPVRFFEAGHPIRSDGQAYAFGERIPALSPESARRALAKQEDFRTIQYEGEPIRVFSRPLRLPNGEQGAIQIVRRLEEFQLWERAQLGTLAIFVPVACLAAGVGAWFIATLGLRPVSEMAQVAQTISADNLEGRIPTRGHDELAELGGAFNRVLERLEAAFRRQRQFTADASHELRTPLTRIRLVADVRSDDPQELRQALAECGRSAESMTRLVEQLLLLSRADSGSDWRQVASVRVSEVLAAALDRLPDPERVEVEVLVDPLVEWDRDAMSRAVSNLLDNAIRFSPETVPVQLRVQELDGQIEICVRDSGPGIAREDQTHIFDRFHRLDSARTGAVHAGLGLSIVSSIVEAHGGTVAVSSELGQGATFCMKVPKTHKFLITGL